MPRKLNKRNKSFWQAYPNLHQNSLRAHFILNNRQLKVTVQCSSKNSRFRSLEMFEKPHGEL